MENPLLSFLQKQNVAAQLYGLPGTYKTTFLLQIIHERLKEGNNSIYLIDTSDSFPIVRLKQIKHLVKDAKFICRKCGRAATKEENLCDPTSLE